MARKPYIGGHHVKLIHSGEEYFSVLVDLIRSASFSIQIHVYILQTPLFRVRNKKETIYCYSDQERIDAIEKLKPKPEITRFKGLGEISPDEFKNFIGETIRLDPIMMDKNTSVEQLLSFYMGKNTPDRQDFIINNLKVELDTVEAN